ncbi:MAG: 5-formyltetrahydrofolate cyclo-ligase [Chlorobi bacterium]|nr:5-formyltetrahydrofolate cyclo-ligase [Chlorobiota bacterium]
MTKAEVRAAKLAQRNALNATMRREYSLAIAEHLWAQPEYIRSSAIHVYLPIRGEVDTQPIIERAWQENKHVLVPLVVQGDSDLRHSYYCPGMTLIPGIYSIPQPASPELLDNDALLALAPLVLVPVVAFDQHLHRLGYGKGYYDRFLTQLSFVRFGLAYAFQYGDFPTDEHDVPLDAVITELGIARRW